MRWEELPSHRAKGVYVEKGGDLRTISHARHLVLPVLQTFPNRRNRIRVSLLPRKSK